MVPTKVQHILSKAWMIIAALLCVAVLWSMQYVSAANTTSGDQRIVTIYDRGVEQTIITRADTVAGALDQAGIAIEQADLVEPAQTEKLVANNYSINVYRARPVVVSDGQKRVRVMTAEQSPLSIAEAADTTLYDEDKATIERVDDVLADGGAGLKLSIDRATVFTFVLYGKQVEARTQATTVGEMLKEKQVTLSAEDSMSLSSSAPLVAGMTVEVWRNGVQTATQEEEIAMPTEQVKDQDRDVGFKEVRQIGKPGKKQVTYEINMQNGIEVSRRIIQEVQTAAPVKQVEAVGAKLTNTFSGSFAEALARLRSCEGSYTSNTGNGYYGAYQYDIQTWGGYMGYANASLAPPAVQDQKAWETYQRRGWQPWPSCKVKMGLQDIYR